jgi:hypothetical protein
MGDDFEIILRGGSWDHDERLVRCARALADAPCYRSYGYCGFRPVAEVRIYSFDPTTGKPLRRSGIPISVTAPMTQEELNLQTIQEKPSAPPGHHTAPKIEGCEGCAFDRENQCAFDLQEERDEYPCDGGGGVIFVRDDPERGKP